MFKILSGLSLAFALVAVSFGSANAQMYAQHRGVWGQSLPSGTYLQSCRHAHMNGTILTAACTNDRGYWMRSSLDVTRCRPWSDIGNVNGRLRCVHNRR